MSEEEFLKNYNIHDFAVPLATVDIAIFTIKEEQLHVLLVKRAQHPEKSKWALPGGFIDLEHDITLGDTAKRKLKEKTGIATPYLEQVETVGGQTRDARGWSLTVTYFALLSYEHLTHEQGLGDDTLSASDASSEKVEWVAFDKAMSKMRLGFDHKDLLMLCYSRLKSKVSYTSLPVNLMPELFTLSELQKVFEVILGESVEKKSFRRRILDANILNETKEVRTGSNRPAKLYTAKPEAAHHVFPRRLEGAS